MIHCGSFTECRMIIVADSDLQVEDFDGSGKLIKKSLPH